MFLLGEQPGTPRTGVGLHQLILQELRPEDGGARRNSEARKNLEMDERKNSEGLDRLKVLYQFPASKRMARIHMLSQKYNHAAEGNPPVCRCCKWQIDEHELSLCEPTTPPLCVRGEQPAFKLDQSGGLFFATVKLIMLFLLFRCLLVDAFAVAASALFGKYCQYAPEACDRSLITETSTENLKGSPSVYFDVANILQLVFVCLAPCFFAWARRLTFRFNDFMDLANHTPDDYTVMVRGIPRVLVDERRVPGRIPTIEFNFEQQLKELFTGIIAQWIDEATRGYRTLTPLEQSLFAAAQAKGAPSHMEGLKAFLTRRIVRSISLCFDLGELERIAEVRNAKMAEHLALYKKDKAYAAEDSVEWIPNQISLINRSLLALANKFSRDNSADFNLSHFVGKAFVSFEFQHFRDYLLNAFDASPALFRVAHKQLRVSLAKHPAEMLWVNMKIGRWDRYMRVAGSYFVLCMSVAFAFVVLSCINAQDLDGVVLPLVLSACTFLINTGLSFLIERLTRLERHYTLTDFDKSLIIKTVITQFLNTSVLYFMLDLNFLATVFRETPKPHLSSQGLVSQITSLILFSGMLNAVADFVNPTRLLRRLYLLAFFRKKPRIEDFQVRVNERYKYPAFEFATKYAYYIVQLFMVSFYGFLSPLSSASYFAILLVQYWVDKFTLFKRSSSEVALSFELTRVLFKLIEVSLVLSSLGACYFTYRITEAQSLPALASVLVAVAYLALLFFAPYELEAKMFEGQKSYEDKRYIDCASQKLFKDYYWTSNPATTFSKEPNINDENEMLELEHAACQFVDEEKFHFREKDLFDSDSDEAHPDNEHG